MSRKLGTPPRWCIVTWLKNARKLCSAVLCCAVASATKPRPGGRSNAYHKLGSIRGQFLDIK